MRRGGTSPPPNLEPKMKISTADALRLILDSDGRLFSVTFVKRSDGSLRSMVARRGVSKGVTGAGMSYDPADHKLVTVYEFTNGEGQFRSIPIDGVTSLTIDGQAYEVE